MKAEKVKSIFKIYECLWLSDTNADFKNFLLSAVTVSWVPYLSTDLNSVTAHVRYMFSVRTCTEIFSRIDLNPSFYHSVSVFFSSYFILFHIVSTSFSSQILDPDFIMRQAFSPPLSLPLSGETWTSLESGS